MVLRACTINKPPSNLLTSVPPPLKVLCGTSLRKVQGGVFTTRGQEGLHTGSEGRANLSLQPLIAPTPSQGHLRLCLDLSTESCSFQEEPHKSSRLLVCNCSHESFSLHSFNKYEYQHIIQEVKDHPHCESLIFQKNKEDPVITLSSLISVH